MDTNGQGAYYPGKTVNLRTFQNQIIPAGGQREFAAEGAQFYVLESTGVFNVQFDGAGEALVDKSVGFEVLQGASNFTKVTLKNPSDVDAVTVTFTVTDGRITDNRASFTAAAALPVNIVSPDPLEVEIVNAEPNNAPAIGTGAQVTIAAAGSTAVAAANLTRKQLVIQNIGAVLVVLNGFWRLDVGEKLELQFSDAITAATLISEAGKVQVIEG